MENPIFQTRDFESMARRVAGACNGISGQERWEKETPLFVQAIMQHITEDVHAVLDYGCGVGRLAKGVLIEAPEHIELYGVDDSRKQLESALAYINHERFETLLPHELHQPIDLVYSIYVFQHIPAIELREALQRIHSVLRPGGLFLYCSSDYRMSVRYDKIAFFDDRFLGVNVRKEVERFFEPIAPLFDDATIDAHDILRQMLRGEDVHTRERVHIPHPAIVYRRKDIEGPLFNVPL